MKQLMQSVYWSNTTTFTGIIYFLHKVQLHVSVLDNGHLQVVHEILIILYILPINIVVLDEYIHSTLATQLGCK